MRTFKHLLLWPATSWNDLYGRRPWWLIAWGLPWVLLILVTLYVAAIVCCAATLLTNPRHVRDTWDSITNA